MNLLYYQFKLQGSWRLGAIFISVYGGSVLTVCFISILWWIKAFLGFIVILDCYKVMRLYALLSSKKSVTKFWYEGEGKWFLQKHQQEAEKAAINYPIFVSSNIIIINFILRNGLGKTSVLVFKSMIDRSDFKKLKMILKISAG